MITSSPAFKEWRVIVEALGAGEQIIILRKGGIAEEPGGFRVDASRFWLFPTRFHAQLEKTKPAATRWFQETAPTSDETSIALRFWAEVVHTRFINDEAAVARLSPHHLWSDAAVTERFHWGKPPGLHVIIVRVFALKTPIILPITKDMGGCRSWIDVPELIDAYPSSPVLCDADFEARRRALGC